MADDREEWLRESLEALDVPVYVYDPTPATDPPFAEGVTKGYLVWRMPDQALVADCVVMVDEDGFSQFEQTSDWRPTTIKEDE